jgi:hydrogenase/urease accessory protein HupE
MIQSNHKGWKPGICLMVALLVCSILCPMALRADEFRPAMLEITEREGGWIDVNWKVPMKGEKTLAITPVLPDFLTPLGEGSSRRVSGTWLESRTYRSGGTPLSGATLRIEGLAAVPADVMVRIHLLDGGEHTAILRSGSDSFTVPMQATKWEIATSYTSLGIVHILEGYDHLLFVLALLLIVTGFRKLLRTITAFTVAHSITLALSTLGWVHVPSAPTEAIISLSILFLALEILRKRAGEVPLTYQKPWLVALAFGLFHGLGFAGALAEMGVPQNEVPLALLMFNVGVELGQIFFCIVVISLLAMASALRARLNIKLPEWTPKIMPYAIGITAAFWTIERTMSFL